MLNNRFKRFFEAEGGAVLPLTNNLKCGGDVFESIAISNLLKQSSKTIEIYVDALAGSGASIITMAGDKRIMYSNAMIMIHQASTCIYGNADQFRKTATDLDKIDSAVIASYKDKIIT